MRLALESDAQIEIQAKQTAYFRGVSGKQQTRTHPVRSYFTTTGDQLDCHF